MLNKEQSTPCTCGQAGHGNAHEPGCPRSDRLASQLGMQAGKERCQPCLDQTCTCSDLPPDAEHPINYRKALDGFAPPIPTPDALRTNADLAHDKLYGFPSDDVRSALADKIRYLHGRKNLGPLYGDSAVTDDECALIVAALRSATVSAPDFEMAARALGFAQLPNGKWYNPSPSVYVNTASTFEKAEDIFDWWGVASGNTSAPEAKP